MVGGGCGLFPCFGKKPKESVDLDPVLLISGIAGSILHAKNKKTGRETRIWVRILLANLEFKQKAWSIYNPETGYTESLDENSEIVVPEDDYGLYAIDILDPSWWMKLFQVKDVYHFHDTIDMLVGCGYEKGTTLFGYGYDFRQSNRIDKAMDGLKVKLSTAYKASGGKKVNVISHSMGGLLLSCFLSLHHEVFAKYVNKWICIACPFQGAPGCIDDSLLTGLQFVSGFESNFFVSRWAMHQLLVECPSIYEMLPNPNFKWKMEPEIQVWRKNPEGKEDAPAILESYGPKESVFLFEEALKDNKVEYGGNSVPLPFNFAILDCATKTGANTYFLVTMKGGYNNVKSCVLLELFVSLLKDELNEILYQAGVAKLETSMSIVGDKLELKLYGFNEKLPALLSKILALAKSFSPAGDRFEVIKEMMERSYRNANMKPLNHSSYLRLQVLREDFWDVDDKLQVLVNSSLADLKAFIPELLSQLHIESLCHGNLSKEEAIEIADIFKHNFPVEPLPVEFRHEERVICFPSAANLVRDVCVKNKLEENSVVELYFQIEQDVGPDSTRLRALADLFEEIVQEPLFDQLRTKEQLGYVVQCSVRVTYRVLGFCFCVQSSEYNPVYLLGRIDAFINGVQKLLDELDIESFEYFRNGLIAKKLEKDPSLSYETGHLWDQIVDKRYLFDMSEKEAEVLRSICKDDVVKWYNTYLKPTSPKRRRLAICVWGCNTNMKEKDSCLEPTTPIEDLALFKKSAEFYPSLC